MQDLSSRYNPPGAPLSLLVPSSQEGGNLIQADLAERTMTAMGSEPVSPLPPALEGSHPAPTQSGDSIELSTPGTHERPKVLPADDGRPTSFTDMHQVPAARDMWEETK